MMFLKCSHDIDDKHADDDLNINYLVERAGALAVDVPQCREKHEIEANIGGAQ